MKQLILLLTKQISEQIVLNNTNIVRLESFDNPIIYKAICANLQSDDRVDSFVFKLSKEKYIAFVSAQRAEWNSALMYLHQGKNVDYSEDMSESYMDNSYVDYNNAMTKWRNESASYSGGKTVLVLLMGTEAAQDTGGLADTSFAINPQKVIYELKNDYSKWFVPVLLRNGINANKDTCLAIHTLYRAIFSSVNIDLVKLSSFVDSLSEMTFLSAQELIGYICETLNSTWEIPSVVDLKLIPKVQNLSKGTLKSAKIITDAISFIERADDIPSPSAIAKLEKKFDKYAEENGIDYSDPFPKTTSLFVNFSGFQSCVIDFMSGKDLEVNRAKLLKLDFAYISKILGMKLAKAPSEKPLVVSGDPLAAYCKMIFNAMYRFKQANNCLPSKVRFRLDHVSLSDCTNEQKEDSYMHICNYMGGMLQFINDSDIENEGNSITLEYDQGIDPFDFTNISEILDKIKCSGKWGDPCKISFTVDLTSDVKEEKYEYKWVFSPNSPWLNAFSYLSEVLNKSAETYTLPTMVVCNNIQDYLICESEDEFYAQLSQIREEVLFETHRQELRKFFKDTEPLAQFDALCSEFKNFAEKLTQNGLFSSLEELRMVVSTYSKMLESAYNHFDLFSDVQREKLPLLVNSFVITSNNEILSNCEMKEVLVPAYNPVLLEKIDAKLLFVRAGFREMIENFVANQKNYEAVIENFIQLSSITQAMDTINRAGNNYLICRSMWEYYGVYYGVAEDADLMTGNSFGSSIVTDDEDASAMLHATPKSNIVVRNILDYIRTFPARIDGINIAFVAPEDMQHIVAAIHSVAKNLEKQEIYACINIEIICINSKKNSNSYLKKWLDSYFSDEKCVTVNTFLKNIVINVKDDIENIRSVLEEYDLCFNYNILKTVGVEFEPSLDEKIDKDMIKFPMTFIPDTIPATHGKSRKVCVSQFQFIASRAQTQISNVMGNPHTIRNTYRAFKKIELLEMSSKLIDISHECCKWVVCVDSAIDRHMLETNKSKIIGFTTGEGSYGELNVTVSARKDILSDIKVMLRKRITEKFANWDEDRLQAAADYCVDHLSNYMDGSRILKALNPYDYEIHSFLAYVLTLQMLGMTEKDEKYLLRSLISLDSYKHWFEEDDGLNIDSKRPDFMLLEIPNTPENLDKDKKLHINIKIIECKMGYKSEGHLAKAQTQLEKGIRTMSANWDPENESVMHRYWLNQLYRAVIFTQLNMDNTSNEYSIIREKIYGILQGNYDLSWSGDIFAFWLDSNSEVPDEWDIQSDITNYVSVESMICHNCGQMFIQKMLLPPERRSEAFAYNEVYEPDAVDMDDEPEDNNKYGSNIVVLVEPETNAEIHIPKANEVYVPFIKHLGDINEHSRKADLAWFERAFDLQETDKKLVFESNGHPKWETVLDVVISEFRKNGLLENSQLGSYHITEFGKAVCNEIETKDPNESFISFVEAARKRFEIIMADNNGDDAGQNESTGEPAECLGDNAGGDNLVSVSDGHNYSIEDVRLLIGADIRTGENYYWEFGNKNLNNRHLLINGNSGCGKTYCIQTLLMEAALQGVSAVVFDYTGGFANSKLDSIFKETLGDRIKQRVVKIAKIPVNPFEKNEIQIDEDIFVPEEDADVADKISEIFKAVYDLGDQQKSAIYSAVLNGLKIHGNNMSFPIMVDELENLGTNYAKTVISKIQAFTDFNPFATDDTFSWAEIRDSKGMVYVFQFAGYGRDIQVLLTELLLWDIWNFCVKNGDETKPFILVMDEAQNLSHGDKSPSAKILTEGRKFGISGWYATQFMKPQLSDDEIQRLQQAGQKLYFCPPDDGVMTVAKNIDITSQGAKDWADRLKKLKKGECVTCGNMVRNGKWAKYDPRIVKVTSLQDRKKNNGGQ